MHPVWIHSFIKTAGPCKHLRWQPALFHTSATFGSPRDDFSPALSGAEKHYGTQIYLPDKTYYSTVLLPSLAPQGLSLWDTMGHSPRALILGLSCLLSVSSSSCSGKLYFCLKRQEALLVQPLGCPPGPPLKLFCCLHTLVHSVSLTS